MISGQSSAAKAFFDRLPNTVVIEQKLLFSDQYNTAEGFRVHDWYTDYLRWSRGQAVGYYLDGDPDQLQALQDAKDKQHICGYCGARYDGKPQEFCNKCLDSAYLKESDLRLLRLLPVSAPSVRPELSETERAELLPIYVDRQVKGKGERSAAKRAKDRERVESEYRKKLRDAEAEFNGFSFLLDRNYPLDNVIFYDHSGVFCFGWRSPLEDSVVSALLDIISEFPAPYQIKCADGRKLEGGAE